MGAQRNPRLLMGCFCCSEGSTERPKPSVFNEAPEHFQSPHALQNAKLELGETPLAPAPVLAYLPGPSRW